MQISRMQSFNNNRKKTLPMLASVRLWNFFSGWPKLVICILRSALSNGRVMCYVLYGVVHWAILSVGSVVYLASNASTCTLHSVLEQIQVRTFLFKSVLGHCGWVVKKITHKYLLCFLLFILQRLEFHVIVLKIKVEVL